MGKLLIMYGIAFLFGCMVGFIRNRIRQRREEKQFFDRMRKLSNTVYDVGNGMTVRYDVSLEYPTNIFNKKTES